jgi:hypothetical protein
VSGPAPQRKFPLWDGSAKRKNTLTVTCAHTGELRSSKDATQAQMAKYADTRNTNLLRVAAEKGINLHNSDGRSWLKRARAGLNETWVRKVCTSSGFSTFSTVR